ncbi:MAG: YrdB family protein [Bacteroidota bacterium]
MGSHPLNLALRFLLELTALFVTGLWGWKQTDSWWRFLLAIGLPVVIGAIWVTFAVPDDPSRSGNAPVVVPGFVRLVIELCMLGFGSWALYQLGHTGMGLGLAVTILIHYVISYDRVAWLLSQ